MIDHWTFGKKIGFGFALTITLGILISLIAISSLRTVVSSKDRVILIFGQSLVDAQRLAVNEARKSASSRGYILSSDESFLSDINESSREIKELLETLRKRLTNTAAQTLISDIQLRTSEYQVSLDQSIGLKKSGKPLEEILNFFKSDLAGKRAAQEDSVQSLVDYLREARNKERQSATDEASRSEGFLILIASILVGTSILTAFVLTRNLTRQIGTAVQKVQSSSTELQAAATQQATAATEHSTAMNEITTTISELLATSRQIADSAQRVSQIADQTARSAGVGENTMGKAQETFGGIRKQVELIVNHMLDLGRKSQQIGAVLEIVAELSEQTNILAINATIEAAGAGDSGKRFAIVADEIRKLADRVGGSTKEIRLLIEDVRSAVNTTVMATETGSKAVDAGSKQFTEAASSFKQIASLVTTTTEASREIELSTKQQTSAVEQVNVAVVNVSQAARETEASSGQTLQTASELAGLSRDLSRLIKPAN